VSRLDDLERASTWLGSPAYEDAYTADDETAALADLLASVRAETYRAAADEARTLARETPHDRASLALDILADYFEIAAARGAR